MDLDNNLDDSIGFNKLLNPMLSYAQQLTLEGFALHWLVSREKRPVQSGWSTAPVATVEALRATYRDGYNLGVRLGEPSLVAGQYLHAIDMDVRAPDLADEAWDALTALFPTVDFDALPRVQSGSGGASLHLYFLSERPLQSKKLWVSEGKHRTPDGKWHNDAEIELMGTGRQVVLPPSIHPNGKPYQWVQEFDFYDMLLSGGPALPASAIESLAAAETETYDYESREPLTFKPGQLERVLGDIPVERLDDYSDWVVLGQALHHQFGAGIADGFELWLKHSARSKKFDDDQRGMLRKWRGFGRNRRKPVTMASVVEWAADARSAAWADAFDDLDDEPALEPAKPAAAAKGDAFDMDALLGGGDGVEGDEEPAEPLSDLDLLGAGGEDGPPGELDWASLLDLNEEGAIKPTLHNVELMVRNDARLAGLPQLNEFTLEPVQRVTPGVKAPRRRNPAKQTRQLTGPVWTVKDTLNGELWSDDRDFAIRSILEAPKTQGGYGVKVTDRDLKAAIVLAASDNRFHPVREYLESTEWDGKPRVDSLFTDYVGAPDDAYSRSVARMMLVAAVTRIYEPGHKFDFVVILEGLQGKRKSTFIQVLGKNWYAELEGNFGDQKQMIELMQGAWIIEIPELSGFNRSDVRSIKAFMSRQKDRARLAYARRAGEFPRQCIYIASTNDREYLRDSSGGRRFWPMLCALDSEIDIDRLRSNVDQIWAEARQIYLAMRKDQPWGILPLHLTDKDALALALGHQESRRVESADDALAGRIEEWLSQPINTGSFDQDIADGQPIYRTETCLLQVWVECLSNEQRAYGSQQAQLLGRAMQSVKGWAICTVGSGKKRFKPFGQQRFYSFGGNEGYLRRSGL